MKIKQKNEIKYIIGKKVSEKILLLSIISTHIYATREKIT